MSSSEDKLPVSDDQPSGRVVPEDDGEDRRDKKLLRRKPRPRRRKRYKEGPSELGAESK
jgi:hypothetical protein